MSWASVFDSSFGTATWLVYSAISGLLLLSIGAIAVRCCRQSIYRIRIIQWTFVACLIVPAIQYFGLMPFYKVAVAAPHRVERSHWSTPVAPAIVDQINADDAAISEMIRNDRRVLDNHQRTGASSSEPNVDHSVSSKATTADVLSRSFSEFCVVFIRLIYFAILAVFAVRWIVGALMRLHLQRSCQNASQHVAKVLESIAGRSAKSVRLLQSDRIASPVMWGIARPTIVLPMAIARNRDENQLRWSLAHEWSHIQRFDFLAHQLAAVTKFVCFFQPLYWWLKRELSLCQDIIADAFAASFGESEDYAEFLIEMSKKQNHSIASAGLGIAERRSNLFKRVGQLVQPNRRLLMSASKLQTTAMAIAAIILIATIGSIQIIGRQATANDAQPVANENDEAKVPDGELKKSKLVPLARNLPPAPGVQPITYHGKVVDSVTGKPIPDAVVEVSRELYRDPITNDESFIEITEHRTNELGEYQFTLPPEQAAQKTLYLNFRVHHPTYQPSGGWVGYSHSMIAKNLEKGDPPFFSTIKLDAGAPITGVIASPDGVPLEGVQVRCYASRPISMEERKATYHVHRSLQSAQTDKEGRFLFNVATPGDGVLWFYPKDFAAEAHRLRDRRGDLGTFKLSDGVRVTGRVLDEKGMGIPNVGIEYRMNGSGPEADEFLNGNYADDISGGTTTGDDGTFALVPLGPGKYRIEVTDWESDTSTPQGNFVGDWRTYWLEHRRPKMPYVFDNRHIDVASGKPIEPLEFQALPQVSVKGRFVDSQGNPLSAHVQHLSGRFKGQGFLDFSARALNDGRFEFRGPKGLEKAEITVGTNEHSSLRWKLAGMKDLNYGQEIPLGMLDQDVDGIVIVRYVAPMLLIKAVDEHGLAVSDFTVKSKYAAEHIPVNGVVPKTQVSPTGPVSFEHQADGRLRSHSLVPDEEIEIDAIKDGFESQPQSVKLKEGETRELTFVLKRSGTVSTTP